MAKKRPRKKVQLVMDVEAKMEWEHLQTSLDAESINVQTECLATKIHEATIAMLLAFMLGEKIAAANCAEVLTSSQKDRLTKSGGDLKKLITFAIDLSAVIKEMPRRRIEGVD